MFSGMPPSPGISRGRRTTAAGVTQSLGAALLASPPQSIPGRETHGADTEAARDTAHRRVLRKCHFCAPYFICDTVS